MADGKARIIVDLELNRAKSQAEALNRTLKSLGDDLTAAQKARVLSKELDVGRNAASALAREFKRTGDVGAERLQELINKTRTLDQTTAKARSGFVNLGQAIATGFATAVFTPIVNQISQIPGAVLKATTDLEKFRTTLNFAAGDATKGAADYAFVRAEIERLKLPLTESVQGFSQLSAAAKGTALEGAGARDAFTAIGQAARVFNLSAEQSQGAITAFTQIISKGKVQAEELRGQLGERIPGAFQIFARALGVSTQELDKLLEQGKVGLPEFQKFIQQLAKETASGLPGALNTTAANLQQAQNRAIEAAAAFGNELAPALNEVLKAANGIDLTKLAKNTGEAIAQVVKDTKTLADQNKTLTDNLGGATVSVGRLTVDVLTGLGDATKKAIASNIQFIAIVKALEIGLGNLRKTADVARQGLVNLGLVRPDKAQTGLTELGNLAQRLANDFESSQKRTQTAAVKTQQTIDDLAKSNLADAVARGSQDAIRQEIELIKQSGLTKEEIEKRKLAITQERLQGELVAQQRLVAALSEADPDKDPKKAEQREQAIRTAKQATAQLQLQIAQNEAAQIEAQKAAIAARYDTELKAIQSIAQLKQANRDAEIAISQSTLALGESEGQVTAAINQLEQERIQTKIAIANASNDENTAKRLGVELAQLQNDQDIKRALTNIEVKKAQAEIVKLQNEGAIAAAEIAKIEAEITLQKERQVALADGKITPLEQQQLDYANRIVEARNRQLDVANQLAKNSEQIAQNAVKEAQVQAQITAEKNKQREVTAKAALNNLGIQRPSRPGGGGGSSVGGLGGDSKTGIPELDAMIAAASARGIVDPFLRGAAENEKRMNSLDSLNAAFGEGRISSSDFFKLNAKIGSGFGVAAFGKSNPTAGASGQTININGGLTVQSPEPVQDLGKVLNNLSQQATMKAGR